MTTVRYLKLVLIRHAQSIGNLQQKMEGQSSTELSVLGHQQAQQLGQALVKHIAKRRTLSAQTITDSDSASSDLTEMTLSLYSSPLLRASQTAHYLIQAIRAHEQPGHRFSRHLRTYQSVDLQEMHQGIFQGLTWSQALARYPELCAQLLSSTRWQPVPQAESLIEARARAHRWLGQVLSQHKPGEVVWAVSHEGFLQHLIAVVMGCDRTWKIPIDHTGIFEFWLAHESYSSTSPSNHLFNPEQWVVRRFNDCSHLHKVNI